MLSHIGRAALRRVGGAPQSTNRALQTIWGTRRVDRIQTPEYPLDRPQFTIALQRSYATSTKAATKPKSASNAEAKPKVGIKKAVKKPLKEKPVKKQAKAKKPKPKPKPKKPVTDEQKRKARVQELKAEALLKKPKGKPSTAWQVLLAEQMQGRDASREFKHYIADAVAKYKSLTPEELEAYNHSANQNKAENKKAYHEWLNSHTPDVVRIANNARTALRKLDPNFRHLQIRDERLPKRPVTARFFFVKERFASSDDFKGLPLADSSKLLGKEWLEMTSEAKKPYEEAAEADQRRYAEEFKTAFQRDSRSTGV